MGWRKASSRLSEVTQENCDEPKFTQLASSGGAGNRDGDGLENASLFRFLVRGIPTNICSETNCFVVKVRGIPSGSIGFEVPIAAAIEVSKFFMTTPVQSALLGLPVDQVLPSTPISKMSVLHV